jgi:hypothetical protein
MLADWTIDVFIFYLSKEVLQLLEVSGEPYLLNISQSIFNLNWYNSVNSTAVSYSSSFSNIVQDTSNLYYQKYEKVDASNKASFMKIK